MSLSSVRCPLSLRLVSLASCLATWRAARGSAPTGVCGRRWNADPTGVCGRRWNADPTGVCGRRWNADPTGVCGRRWNADPTARLASLASCLATVLLVLPAAAAFFNSTETLTDDSTGLKTRTEIAAAIADADALLGDLAPADASARKPEWTRIYGTAGADDAITAVDEVRDALVSLRDNWDLLSVQTLSIKTGWNSFYVYVDDPAPMAAVVDSPGYAARLTGRVAADFVDPAEAGTAELLRRIGALADAYVAIRTKIISSFNSKVVHAWPFESLSCYMGSPDAAAQFTTDPSAEASAANAYATWSAAAPDAVNLPTMLAGYTYAAFSTSSVTRTVALLGAGVTAGSMTWRRTGGSDNPAEWNRLGIVTERSRTTPDAVLVDTDFGHTGLAKMSGNSSSNVEFTVAAPGKSLSIADGEVLIASATGTSSWYPAPVASPASGVIVPAEDTISTFQLRNTTAAPQVVSGLLYRTGILGSALKSVRAIEIQSTAVRGWELWYFDDEAETNAVFVDELAAGECRTYRVRIPRTDFDLACRGKEYVDGFERQFSAVMCFSYGSNAACTYLSLVGESSQGAVTAPWPTGLWVGTMSFDTVSQVVGSQTINHSVPAGGQMRVRAIVHVGTNGVAKLLHHVAIESTTVTNAAGESVVQTTLYAGKAKSSSSSTSTSSLNLSSVQRLDSVAMDIDHPVVEGEGDFTNTTVYSWTIAPEGRANPFYHPFHPDHDGLTADYETKAPSGDDMNNYRNGEVKPETWSIVNTLKLAVTQTDSDDDEARVSGTCTWTLGNLLRQVNGADVRTRGTFVLKRVQNAAELVE